MRKALISTALTLMLAGQVMAEERISISSEWGNATAVLNDNAAAQALLKMLPVTIEMGDHLRQEKTGSLPSPLPSVTRQKDFSTGTLGLWGDDHFVVYYRDGRVPSPGIIILGKVDGDVSFLDRPGSLSIQLKRVN
jgi:hypothetical protein